MYIGQSGRQYVPSSRQFIDGGMGEIHFVFDPMNRETKYALKLCKDDSIKFRRRFEREVLIHHHLCGLKVGFDGVIPFVEPLSTRADKHGFVMHYIEYGEALFDWARKRIFKLSPKEQRIFLLELLLRLLRLLNKIHQKGVLHNDIKPENILVAGTGTTGAEYQIYFLDFGLARKMDEQLMVTTIGTLGYSAPELLGQANQADQSSDLFALCFVWLEIVRGQKNFDETEYAEAGPEQLENLWKQRAVQFEVIEGPFIGENLALLLNAMLQPQAHRKYRETSSFLARVEYCIQIADRQIAEIEQLSFGQQHFYLGWSERIGEDITIPVQVHLQNPPQFRVQQGKIVCPHYAQVSTEIHWSGLKQTKHVFTPSTQIAWSIRKKGSYADIYPDSEEYPALRLWYKPENIQTTVQFQIRMKNHEPYLTSYQVHPESKSSQISIYLYDTPNIWEVLSIQGQAFPPLSLQHNNALFICWDEEQERIVNIFQHRDFQMHSVMRQLHSGLTQLQAELHRRAHGEKIQPARFPFTDRTKENFLLFLQKIELRYPKLQPLIQSSMMRGKQHWNYQMWEIYGLLVHYYQQNGFENLTTVDWVRLAKNCLYHQVSQQKYWLIEFLLPRKPTTVPMISSPRISLREQHPSADVNTLDLSDGHAVLKTIQKESKRPVCYFRYQLQGVHHHLSLYSDQEFSIGRWRFEEKHHLPLFISQTMPIALLKLSRETQKVDVSEEFQSFVQYRKAHQKLQIIDAGFCRICPKCGVVYSDGIRDCQLHGKESKVFTQYQGQYHTHHFQLQFQEHPALKKNIWFSQCNPSFGWGYTIASSWSFLPGNVMVFLRQKNDIYIKAAEETIYLVSGTRKKKIDPNQVSIWKNEKLLLPTLNLFITKYMES